MSNAASLKQVKPGAKLRITPVGVALTISVEGKAIKANDDLLIVSLDKADEAKLVHRGYFGEFLVRDVKQGAEFSMVLAGTDEKPGRLAFQPSPDNRRRFMRVVGDFTLSYELLENKQQVQEAIYNLEHSVIPEEEAAIFDNEELRGPMAAQLLRLESMIGLLGETVNELAEKTDFLVARADGRDCMLPRRRRGKIVDLSGSGFAFSCQDEELKEGGFILVSFDISPVVHQKVRGVAKIVQLQASDEAAAHEPPEQRVAVDFHHISEDDQDKIIKYVFSVQRQFLRRHRDSV